MGLKTSSGGGEIVRVQGGHIIRATGRKDRHSKVFTAKGPRDRRVRLAAHTAIQFYDVQDRLGYDRPSKAVDWLIKKAKASIDMLAELPPWDPNLVGSNTFDGGNNVGSTHQIPVGHHTGTSYDNLHNASNEYDNNNNNNIPQGVVGSYSLNADMKSFFPINNSNSEDNNPMSFQNYPHDLISRGGNPNEDLCLSLQSLQDPGATTHHQTHSNHDPVLFHGSGSLGFDSGWVDQHHQHQDLNRFSRLMGWAGSGGGNGSEGRPGGILFNHHPSLSLPPQGMLMGQQLGPSTTGYSQRGTLQSSFISPFVRAMEDHNQHHHHSSISGVAPRSDGSMGFCFPSQIQHGELQQGAASISNRASSSASLSPDSSQN